MNLFLRLLDSAVIMNIHNKLFMVYILNKEKQVNESIHNSFYVTFISKVLSYKAIYHNN